MDSVATIAIAIQIQDATTPVINVTIATTITLETMEVLWIAIHVLVQGTIATILAENAWITIILATQILSIAILVHVVMIKIVEIAVIVIIMATIIGEMEFGQEMKERLKIPIITKVHQFRVQVLIKGPQVGHHQITMEMLLYLLEKCE